MLNWKGLCCCALYASLLFGVSLSSSASTIQATVVDLIAYGQVDVSLNSGSNWARDYAGTIAMKRTGGDSTLELEPDTTNFVTFCIEPREGISKGGSYTWDVKDLSYGTTSLNGIGSTKADQIRELIGNEYAQFGDPLTNVRAAAIQIAIWEIVEEKSGTLNVTNGNIRFRNGSISNMLSIAQQMLDRLDGLDPKAGNIWALTNNGAQDILVMAAPGSIPNVEAPEPASVALLGIGLVFMGALRRRAAAKPC